MPATLPFYGYTCFFRLGFSHFGFLGLVVSNRDRSAAQSIKDIENFYKISTGRS